MKKYYVYIMSSSAGTLYTGVTSKLRSRVYAHKHKLIPGFTNKYNINRLVYYEETYDVKSAITREKQIKSWRREKKIMLINSINSTWRDLSEDWFENEGDESEKNQVGRNFQNPKL
jgi:putative endonuclease